MTFRFGTFNLFQYCSPPNSWYIKKDKFTPDNWKIKNSWIKSQIIAMNCDIIGFQEVFSIDELKLLCQELGYNYFLSVDTPKVNKKKANIFISTVLALASKYPIIGHKKVRYDISSIKRHSFKGIFSFSRVPIKAIIELPNKNKIAVYVNHFKSNRLNEFEFIFNKNTTMEEKIQKTKESLEKNYSPSLQQRLCETSSLYFDIKESKIPTIFLCDLNDKEFSLCIDALTKGKYHNQKNKDILYDAYYYFKEEIYNPHPEQKEIKRKASSYFQGYGNVLDYIFVSDDLKDKITAYKVFDEHLQKNSDGSLLQSDHAQVVCEIKID